MKKSCWLILVSIVLTVFSAGAVAAQTIDKSSVQVRLQVHKGYNGDPETWSWTPVLRFRVNGPISPGSAFAVEYNSPAKAWKFDCQTDEYGAGWLGARDCGMNPPDNQAVTYTGPVDFKINFKNELEGKNATLFSGKFKVDKFHEGVVDLPKFKNNFSYYVDYDWNLPIGYIYDYDNMDHRAGYPPSKTEGRLTFVTWFKGTPDLMNFGKHVAYLYYQGKQVADSTGGDKYGAEGCQVEDAPSEDSPYTYCRHYFTVNATVWDKQAEYHPMDFPMYKNPGEYEIKVLENGKLVRTAKFTMGLGGKLIDTGIGTQSGLGTGRIVIPVQVLGDQDGQWDKNAWKTEAFYQHPLTGFTAP